MKDDIKSVVLIQKPIDLDSASSLALLKEELTREPTHRCAPTVSLHVVEKLWQLLQDPAAIPELHVEATDDSGDDLMALSIHVVNGNDSPRTIRTVGLYGHQPFMLIDFGSSSNFISEQLAT